ncbi:MAG: transcriptional regulator [Gammaproteobacteria bacterium]|nr:transcriptional regulator [Gammaproteobacteria bacterium]
MINLAVRVALAMTDDTSKTAAEPTCPECGVAGIEHFANQESRQRSRNREPWFFVVYCSNCGHVYNTIAKHVFSQTATRVVVQ